MMLSEEKKNTNCTEKNMVRIPSHAQIIELRKKSNLREWKQREWDETEEPKH